MHGAWRYSSCWSRQTQQAQCVCVCVCVSMTMAMEMKKMSQLHATSVAPSERQLSDADASCIAVHTPAHESAMHRLSRRAVVASCFGYSSSNSALGRDDRLQLMYDRYVMKFSDYSVNMLTILLTILLSLGCLTDAVSPSLSSFWNTL